MDPTSEIGRFEDKIRREEARVRGRSELAASSLDAQFESLDDLDQQAEIEARLAALKAGSSGGSAGCQQLAGGAGTRTGRFGHDESGAIVTYGGTEMPSPPRGVGAVAVDLAVQVEQSDLFARLGAGV